MPRKSQPTRKSKSKSKTKRSVRSRTPTPYPRSQSYMNVSQTWKNGIGQRNTVVIQNGHGVKRVEALGPNGQVASVQTRRLTGAERNQILHGKFVHGLWNNCRTIPCL